MLDPRIYRAGFVAVALAVIVFAFSLQDQQAPLSATLVPDAFNGSNAYSSMTSIATDRKYANRLPGSQGDRNLAGYVAGMLKANSFSVSTTDFTAHTAYGMRTLENVIGTRAGMSDGSIVVVAHRDSTGRAAAADASGTATLLTLASVLSGETLNHTVVLASTSGSIGAAGAAQLARALPGPVGAVIVLGDLASTRVRSTVVVPWTNARLVAPPVLRNTVAAALQAQAGLSAGTTSLSGQLVHLAVPLTVSEQAPFGQAGYPAVLLSLSGERRPATDSPVSAGRIGAMGRTVLQTINALDSGSQLPAPSAYLIYHKNVIPAWAVRLLVLALIVPVLMTTVDGLARVRRRGHRIGRRLLWVLSGAVPFLLAAAIAYLAGLVAVLDVVPAGPVGQNDVPLHGRGTALLIVMAVVVVGSLFAVRRLLPLGRRPQAAPRAARGRRDGADDPIPGAVAALLLVMCVVSIAIWVGNPFAAALTVPALHLWLWGLAPDVPLPRPARLAMVVVGVLPGVFVLLYYAVGLGYSPLGLAWTVALMVAGGQVGAAAVLAWSLLLGCAVAASTIAVRLRRDEPAAAELRAVTVRGPVTYAGPGSLGGTESALRR